MESFVYGDNGYHVSGGDFNGYENASFVDFCYFDSPAICAGNVLEVVDISTDAPDGTGNMNYPFRIDPYHAAKYNLTATLDNSELYED
jgi:hypothetical protein